MKNLSFLIILLLTGTILFSCGQETKGLKEEIKMLKEENSFLKAENVGLKKEIEELYKKIESQSPAKILSEDKKLAK